MAQAKKKATLKKAKPAAPKTAAKRPPAPAFTATTAKEITATFVDSVGLTAKIAGALAADNVNILAGTGYSASGMRTKATFTLIVDDLARAERTLDRIGADEIQDSTIILVETENRVGALERITRIIADAGINIFYFYSTPGSGRMATCVIKTADDKKAIKALQKA